MSKHDVAARPWKVGFVFSNVGAATKLGDGLPPAGLPLVHLVRSRMVISFVALVPRCWRGAKINPKCLGRANPGLEDSRDKDTLVYRGYWLSRKKFRRKKSLVEGKLWGSL